MLVQELNERYGIHKQLEFKVENGMTMVNVSTVWSDAKISLYGAQVLSFVPRGQADLLFVSSATQHREGKAIRGGIPVCWPWFGAHPDDVTKPSHGFARTTTWQVVRTEAQDKNVLLELGLDADVNTLKLFPFEFELRLEVVIGEALQLKLKTTNKDDSIFDVSAALHTYFRVSDINKVKVKGLQDSSFKDDVAQDEGIENNESLMISGRVDRRYRSGASLVLNDQGRTVMVEKEGSGITVVWNPGEELARQMADLGDEDYKKMLCLESANSLEDTIKLSPGKTHCLGTAIYLK